MGRLSLDVAGASHGPGLVALITGLPAHLPIPHARLEQWLRLRRSLAGRGPRAGQEADRVEFYAGVRDGRTDGGPVALLIGNRDSRGHSVSPVGKRQPLSHPRPGHGDFAGARKWGLTDATAVAELASGRLTAAYTAAGALCAELLAQVDVELLAHVVRIGPVKLGSRSWRTARGLGQAIESAEASPYLVRHARRDAALAEALRAAAAAGDTLGGRFEVVASGLRPGLGAPQPPGERLDARLAGWLAAIPGVRAVALGAGFQADRLSGRAFHDAFAARPGESGARKSNRAGGIEGGMTNGLPLVVQANMKPIPTLGEPLESVSLVDDQPGPAPRVRGDICAVPAAAVVGRALVACVLADAALTTCGGDTLERFIRHYHFA